jgi:hypothetical protein
MKYSWIINIVFIQTLFVANSFSQTVNKSMSVVNQNNHDAAYLFKNPPESAKPGVLWMWMGSNISKEGITKDLEAMVRRN